MVGAALSSQILEFSLLNAGRYEMPIKKEAENLLIKEAA